MLEPVEDRDFVVCRECGYQGPKLYRHIGKHGLTTSGYLSKYPSAPMRSSVVVRNQTATRMARRATLPSVWRATKVVPCPVCGAAHTVSKAMGSLHDLRCACCKAEFIATGLDSFEGKSEPDDYITCLDCGYRAENLTSHAQNAHPDYRVRYPDASMVALKSAVRDKTALQGMVLSEDTKQRMSASAGRWNAGLTKHTHPSLAVAAKKMQTKVPWNKGLTADSDPRVAEAARKLSMYVGENRPWNNGLAANLTLADFQPFMDTDGRVDHHKVVEATGISWVTVRGYIVGLGLFSCAQKSG
jgi:predicted transcriptional regulator